MTKFHPTFKVLITRTLKQLNPVKRWFQSPMKIRNYISKTYNFQFLKISNFYFRKALNLLLEQEIIEKHETKYLFRLTSSSSKSSKNQNNRKKTPPKKIVQKKKKSPIKKKTITKKTMKANIKQINSKKSTNKAAPIKTKNTKRNSIQRNNNTNNSNVNNNNNNDLFQPLSIFNQKSINPKNEIPKDHAVWQYYDRYNVNAVVQSSDGWYNYDLEANTIVEEEWQKYIANRAMCDVRAVKSGTFEYSVDFMSWTQTNIKHYNHKVRKIRRLDEKRNVTVNPYQNQN